MRYDRDDYIIVNLTNTYSPYNYERETTDDNNNYNVAYEYGSNMHYGGCKYGKTEGF